jgi:hypothetical protein
VPGVVLGKHGISVSDSRSPDSPVLAFLRVSVVKVLLFPMSAMSRGAEGT